jgi:hypothetical protein
VVAGQDQRVAQPRTAAQRAHHTDLDLMISVAPRTLSTRNPATTLIST